MKPHIAYNKAFKLFVCQIITRDIHFMGYGGTIKQAYEDYTRRVVRRDGCDVRPIDLEELCVKKK